MTRTEAAQILGISPDANKDTIRTAFRKKAMRLHPDRNKAINARFQFIELHEAYKYLLTLSGTQMSEAPKSSNNHRQYSKFRSPHHKNRQYTNPYANLSHEEFERRYKKARQAADEAWENESKQMYLDALEEYRNSWQKPLAKVMATLGLVMALLFIVDYSLGLNKEIIPHSDVKIDLLWQHHVAYGSIWIYGSAYTIPNEKLYLINNINKDLASMSEDKSNTNNNNKIVFNIYRTQLFKDIVYISIQSGWKLEKFYPENNAYNSFPIIPIMLLLPMLIFWYEKPTFNFVFFVINYTLYFFPIFALFILFHNGRLMRLFGL